MNYKEISKRSEYQSKVSVEDKKFVEEHQWRPKEEKEGGKNCLIQ
jgi:hypothetical protein